MARRPMHGRGEHLGPFDAAGCRPTAPSERASVAGRLEPIALIEAAGPFVDGAAPWSGDD